ncbi:hypothetical protein Taro_034776 [Colocasia esculenta]|uniref:Uncharacterized protein n=1 Tax=Colocasia esculenta TaxID=4460 RepID=A0A843W3W0_COLES|nr:hypothetical protein [Colocasia esculenta]
MFILHVAKTQPKSPLDRSLNTCTYNYTYLITRQSDQVLVTAEPGEALPTITSGTCPPLGFFKTLASGITGTTTVQL